MSGKPDIGWRGACGRGS